MQMMQKPSPGKYSPWDQSCRTCYVDAGHYCRTMTQPTWGRETYTDRVHDARYYDHLAFCRGLHQGREERDKLRKTVDAANEARREEIGQIIDLLLQHGRPEQLMQHLSTKAAEGAES